MPLPGVPIRVLVVDDSPSARRFLSSTLEEIPGLAVAATAATISIAQKKVQAGGVDAIALDINLDGESGLDLLRWLITEHPLLPVVLVTGDSGIKSMAEARALGAAAIVRKAVAGTDDRARIRGELARAFGARGSSDMAAQPAPATARSSQGPVPAVRSVRDSATGSIPGSAPGGAARLGGLTMPRARELLAVGASTGGPPVVLEFIRTLPADLAMPVVITQHMPESHLPHFARLLADQSKRPVALGVDGELLAPGRFYVAPGGRHMLVVRDRAGLRIALDNGPEEHFCKPAVDPMFRSVAAACAGTAIGVVMTGMGSDGALGAVELRAAGIPVAVQDEASSIVWGMPGATFAAGAADAVVPGDQLARTVAAWMSPFPVAPRGTRS